MGRSFVFGCFSFHFLNLCFNFFTASGGYGKPDLLVVSGFFCSDH